MLIEWRYAISIISIHFSPECDFASASVKMWEIDNFVSLPQQENKNGFPSEYRKCPTRTNTLQLIPMRFSCIEFNQFKFSAGYFARLYIPLKPKIIRKLIGNKHISLSVSQLDWYETMLTSIDILKQNQYSFFLHSVLSPFICCM